MPAISGSRRTSDLPAQRAARGARLSTGARRRQILETALQLFAEKGYRGTTTRRIAEAAGVTEAVIFQHFADKDTLYAAVLEHTAAEAPVEALLGKLEAHQDAGDDRAVLETLYEHIVERHAADPEYLRLMTYSALEKHQLSRRMRDAQSAKLYQFLERFITGGQAAGRFRSGSPAVLARIVLAFPVLYGFEQHLFGSSWPPVSVDEAVDTAVTMALDGLCAGRVDCRRIRSEGVRG